MKSKSLAAIAAAVLTLGVSASVVAGSGADASPRPAAHTDKSTIEHFSITGIGNRQVVIAHGAFVGGGRDVSKGQHDLLHLGGGMLTIRHPNSQSHYTAHFNSKTCYGTFKITGHYTVGRGTGRFAGVTGDGRYRVHGEAILKHTASGACNQRGAPKVLAEYIKAHGPVSMP